MMIRVLKSLWGRRDEGVVTVEAALIFSALGVIGLYVLDLGLVVNRQMQLSNAARAGMQYAIVRRPVGGDTTAIENAVRAAAPPEKVENSQRVNAVLACFCPGVDGASDVPNPCTNSGSDTGICGDGSLRKAFVRVAIEEDFPLIFGLPLVGREITLSKEVMARLN